jgi:hypothetical protein
MAGRVDSKVVPKMCQGLWWMVMVFHGGLGMSGVSDPFVSKWWLVHCDAFSVPISLARYWVRLGSAEAENGVIKERE